jgi:predicted NBD/HSP70 family sugar kinase
VNRSAVLRPLFLDGPLNRVELARLTGLSSGSVTNVTSALLDEGLVVEVGLEESDGGRPRVLLQVNPEFGAVIGVDVGETGIEVEAFDLRMRVIGRAEVRLHPQHHEAEVVIEQTIAAIEQLQAEFARDGRRLLGVGVALPGVVEHVGEARVHAPNIGWSAVPLERIVRERIGVPVFAENGAKTLGQAEMWLGAGRGAQHAVVTLWGTGVGAAIFTEGSLYRGAASSAGEWGHTSIAVGGQRCRCGAAGCLEAYIGAAPLLARWRKADPKAAAPDDPDAQDWVDQLLDAANTRRSAARVLDETAAYFGVAAANLANLFNPERIVVGGWLGLKLGPTLLPRIREVLLEQALDYPARSVAIELGQLGPDAVALGASTLVVERLLASGGVPPNLPGQLNAA